MKAEVHDRINVQNNPVNMIDPDGRLSFLVRQVVSVVTNIVANEVGRGNQLNYNEEDDFRKIQEKMRKEAEEAYYQELLYGEDDPWVEEYFEDLERRIKEEEERKKGKACP